GGRGQAGRESRLGEPQALEEALARAHRRHDRADDGDGRGAAQARSDRHRGNGGMSEEIIRKSRSAERIGESLEFILSDSSVDLYGDVVDVSGWEQNSLTRRIPCLFNHDPAEIVGKWEDIRVENGRLQGRLTMAAAGTSPFHDKIRNLLDQDMIPGVSVGFAKLDSEPLDSTGRRSGRRFKRQRLLEASLVGIPANQNAVQIARDLGLSGSVARSFSLSDATTRLCFGEP